jgi:DNA repair exonuclease SbcCD ATPase subunit
LAAIESQRNTEYEKQVAAFRSQAEADRQKSDENLKNLQAEFNTSLAQANQERQQVLDESKKREADLQAQLEQKTQEAASAQASSQQALAALQSQKQQEDLVAGQLVGLYSVVKANIAAKDYPKAITSLQAIRDYVNSTTVAAFHSIQQRRDIDLFVVDSLTSYVQDQLSAASVNTSSLVAAAGQISEVRAAVSQADARAQAGDVVGADSLYQKALAEIPEIQHSYTYFMTKTRDAEAARQQVLRTGLTRAEVDFTAGRYPEMLVAYKDALTYLPETSTRLDTTLSNILTAGAAQARSRDQAEQATLAAPLLAQADAALAQGKPADAISRYLTVLQRYPQSPQADQAVKGVSNSSSAMSDSADARLAAREAELNAQVAALQKQVSDLSASQGTSSDLAARLSHSEQNAASLQSKLDALEAENQKLRSASQAAAEQGSGSAQLDSLMAAYTSYAAQEDAILTSQGEEKGRLQTIGLRDRFLGSLNGVFKGILDRIHGYDDRFISDSMIQGRNEGRQAAMEQAVDIIIELAKQTTPQQRKNLLDQRLTASNTDPLLTSFLKNLQALPQMQ